MNISLLNYGLGVSGVYRAYIIYKKGDVMSRVYIPGKRVNPLNEDLTLNEVVYNANKLIYPEALWESTVMRDAIPEDKVLPGWIVYETGDEKRPIIMGYLGKGLEMADEWSGSSSGSGAGSGSGGGSGSSGSNSNSAIISGSGKISDVIQNAKSLITKNVKYSMNARYPSDYNTNNPSSLDCSSFVYWCYFRSGLLPNEWPYSTETFWTSNYFEHMAGPNESDCIEFINSGKLQEGDVLLRSTTSNFGSGGDSHALIVAPGEYEGTSYRYINCGGSSFGVGSGAVKGTNEFFNDNSYYGILRYKS